jgi:dipeptidase
MVEGSEADYLSVNYEKLVTVAIKAIQELTEKVERLEKILKENGITHD